MSEPTGLTNLQYAILGLICQGEKTAYAIQGIFSETPMGRYSTSPGAIYPATRRLRDTGLIAARREPGDKGRDRSVYRATPAGEATLDRWLLVRPDEAEVSRHADIAMLRFAFMGGRLADADIRAFLDHFLSASRAQRTDLTKRIEDFTRAGHHHAALTLTAGLMGVDAQIRWARHARRDYADPR